MPAYHLLEATMKKIAALVGILVALSAGSAMAAGTNLAWNDCLSGGGLLDRTVACTNTGTGTMYASFVPPAGVNDCGATDAAIDVVTPNPMVTGSWWLAGTIRWGAAIGSSGSGACPGWADAAPTGGQPFGPNIAQTVPGGNRLRIRFVISTLPTEEQALDSAIEYHNHTVSLKFSSGTLNNAECTAGAAIGVTRLEIQSPTVATIALTSPQQTNCITFRGGGGLTCPGATPVKKATWGSIKALYR
jgi:hypothetical protein